MLIKFYYSCCTTARLLLTVLRECVQKRTISSYRTRNNSEEFITVLNFYIRAENIDNFEKVEKVEK